MERDLTHNINLDTLINNVFNHMLDYQRINNIKKSCLTNTVYFYRSLKLLKNHTVNIRVIPVIVITTKTDITCHLINKINDTIYDTSYEIYKQRNNIDFKYCYSLDELKKEGLYISNDKYRELITKFMPYINISNRINNNENLSNDTVYLNNIADYIDLKLKNIRLLN